MNLIKGRKYSPEKFGKVCVLGLGSTGLSCANFFLSQMPERLESLHVYAGDKTEFAMKAADKLLAAGATVSFDDKTVEHEYDLCVVSPGISNLSDLYTSAEAHCGEVISEVELAWRESSDASCWIAVTGTNGKTTTTSILASVLKGAGKRAVAVGNIGSVAIEAVAADRSKSAYMHTEFYVVEVSSYQIASCTRFAPNVGILLNITPDHIKWHGSFDAYAEAKIALFSNCHTAVLNVCDCQVAKRLAKIEDNNAVCKIIEIGDESEYVQVVFNDELHEICKAEDMQIKGAHNVVNAQAAAAACMECGLSDEQIRDGLIAFKPLEHRLEPCGIIGGVRYFNDSKATNVDSVLVAIDAFEKGRAVFLMGGRDKGTDLTDLVAKAKKCLKGVVCFGECRQRFYDAFAESGAEESENFDLQMADNLAGAFDVARKMTYIGDFVALSPACASFDEFSCFEERGEAFKKLVEDTNNLIWQQRQKIQ